MTDPADRAELAQQQAKRLFRVDPDLSPQPDERPGAADLRRIFFEHAYADSWSRPALDDRSRSLATIAVLASMGLTNELRTHVHGALTLGITPEELVDLCIHVGVYAGLPRGGAAWAVAEEVIAQREKRAAERSSRD